MSSSIGCGYYIPPKPVDMTRFGSTYALVQQLKARRDTIKKLLDTHAALAEELTYLETLLENAK